MRLLILTQKVDQNDSILGFFHHWIAVFATHCEQVVVIALEVGEYKLPQNVRVYSLGKERGVSRIGYLLNFYRIIFRERKNYDVVFVHMNQEYVLLGGVLWKLFGKKVMFWRNHPSGNLFTHIAMVISDKIFCTSKYSFTVRSKKTTLMPVGIDTELFKKNEGEKMENSVLFLARISPVKRQDLLIEALNILYKEGVVFVADFYGDFLPKDAPYAELLKGKTKEYRIEKYVNFCQGISHTETPAVYNTHNIFVNASPSGMYDKTIFEAMACECLILTSNQNLKGEIDDIFLFAENDAHSLASKLKYLLSLSPEMREDYGKMLRNYVIKKHGLEQLAASIMTIHI